MSYILDALKKSDQQRQRGATPTLQAAQATVAVPKRPLIIFYGLFAAALLVVGIMIGWLHPWQTKSPSSATEPVVAESPVPITQPAAPMPSVTPTMQSVSVAHDSYVMPDNSAKPAGVAQGQAVIPFDELPPAIQKDIPAMSIQLHAYSSLPAERLVSINSIRLREGESLMVGLKLEQITPDGMIFSYKGYSFKRGTR